jgi:integrase
MVAMLIACGLRRAELLTLSLESIQQREEHWVIADLVGNGGHVRTVPIPTRAVEHCCPQVEKSALNPSDKS